MSAHAGASAGLLDAAREPIPDFEVIYPLIGRHRAAGVEQGCHDAIYRSIVLADVRSPVIKDRHAAGRRPNPATGVGRAMPEDLKSEPLPNRHGYRLVRDFPKLLVGQATVGVVIALHVPVGRAARVRVDVDLDPIVAVRLPSKESAPAVGPILASRSGWNLSENEM